MDVTIAALAERFPKAFAVYERRRRPLKVGIYNDIVAAIPGIPADELGVVLRVYTINVCYLIACQVGTTRIDLAGEPAGTVSEKEARHAANMVAKWRARRAAQPASSAQVAQVPALLPESPASPKRLSLADLKAAGRARRVEEFVGAGEGKPVH